MLHLHVSTVAQNGQAKHSRSQEGLTHFYVEVAATAGSPKRLQKEG